MVKRFETIVGAYWRVGVALRHPTAPGLTVQDALSTLNEDIALRPHEHRLRGEMHTLRYDIIEGNNKWREVKRNPDSKLIQFTRN